MDESPRQPDETRLSDAERDAVIAQLTEATDHGRITLLEFEERAGLVYAAQFPSQLDPITADLPTRADRLPDPTLPPENITANPVDSKPRA